MEPLMTRRLGLLSVTALIAVFTSSSVASAMGYWNLPGNFCQWCGCGFSGGYHAPYVLGPINGGCCEAWNEVRMPYAPNPYACAPCNSGGCGGYSRGMESPTVMPMEPQPTVVPQAMAPAATGPSLFAAPVQR